MAKITFKAKIEDVYNVDDTIAYQRIKVPELTRSHCDMAAFRSHPKYGSYANSDLFENILKRIKKETTGDYLRLDKPLPPNVSIDTSGFLAQVLIQA